MVGKCRTRATEDLPDRVNPPNITAWPSSVMVREKQVQGRSLDPLLDGEDHNPRTQKDMCINKVGTILKMSRQ